MRFARVLLCLVITLSQMAILVPTVSAEDDDIEDDAKSSVVIAQVYMGAPNNDSRKYHEFVEIYNNTDAPVDVTNWCVKYLPRTGNPNSSTVITSCLVATDPGTTLWLAARGYATFVSNEFNKEYMPTYADAYFDGGMSQTSGYVQLVDHEMNEIDRVGWGAVEVYGQNSEEPPIPYPSFPKNELPDDNMLLRKQVGRVMQDTDKDNEDFIATAELTVHASNVYEEEIVVITEPPEAIVDCAGVVINEVGANLNKQFIELYNTTDAAVSLAGCKLQTNRSSATYTLMQEELEPEEYVAIYISDTELTLTKTKTGTVYLLSSDGKVKNDVIEYSDLRAGTSWSRFMDGWRQTYAVTPGEENVDQPYLPCDDGYYRNMETGRCNKVVIEKPLAACAPDQYRNPETGRCKKTVVSTLTPCKEGQERNPETNRCRSVLGASTTRKPCKENQYRSEETNRCRNLPATSVPDAAFAVQPVEDTGATFVGWWVLGGLALLAVGYGVWEWRREVINILYKLLRRS